MWTDILILCVLLTRWEPSLTAQNDGREQLEIDFRLRLQERHLIIIECGVYMPFSRLPPNEIKLTHGSTTEFSVLAFTRSSSAAACTSSMTYTPLQSTSTPLNKPGITETARTTERYKLRSHCLVNYNNTLNRIVRLYVANPTVYDFAAEWQCHVSPGETGSEPVIVSLIDDRLVEWKRWSSNLVHSSIGFYVSTPRYDFPF